MIGCWSLWDGFENTPSLQVCQNWIGKIAGLPHDLTCLVCSNFPGKPMGPRREACYRIFEECRQSKKSLPRGPSVDEEEVQWRTNCKKRLAKALKDDGFVTDTTGT